MTQNSICGPAVERTNVLGVGISVLNYQKTLGILAQTVARREKGYVAVTGVHGISEAQDDPAFRKILNNAYLCTPDGMPTVWMSKLAGHSEVCRVYGPDLMALVCETGVAKGWRHFFYGGAEGVAQELKSKLEQRFPGLQVTGAYTPPFRPLNAAEEADLIRQVDAAQPDFFWVGLSTPKQERFMAEYLPKLNARVMLGVGAAFLFHAGKVKQAPKWIQQSGLEWAYRIGQEPRRLWKRYAKNNPLFIARILLQKTGLRKYPLD
jgi:N-acetylglucosaminyldiphosphoundecaprenol N-acetyl-beta-D-mannosaminyltransferase